MSQKAHAERERADIDYRLQVAYTVPVEVIVDLREGRVARAVVVDEGISLDPEGGARQECNLRPVPTAIAERATEIAEAGEWPAWEHGF